MKGLTHCALVRKDVERSRLRMKDGPSLLAASLHPPFNFHHLKRRKTMQDDKNKLEEFFNSGDKIKKAQIGGCRGGGYFTPAITINKRGVVYLNTQLATAIREMGVVDSDNKAMAEFSVSHDYVILRITTTATAREHSHLIKLHPNKSEGGRCCASGLGSRLKSHFKNGSLKRLPLRRSQQGPPCIMMFRLP